MNEVQRLMDKVIEFRDERDWAFHHNPKDLSLSLETKYVEMKEELADIFIYALTFAHAAGIDVSQKIEEKLVKNAEKYPSPKS